MPLRLVFDPAEVLHHRSRPVKVFDSGLRQLVEEMYLRCSEWSGVGLAAPQVGINLQLAVIVYEGRRFAICNPEITATEGEVDADEGCLSLPGRVGQVRRYERVTARYRNPHGKGVQRAFSDWLARIVQHETDHLHGILCPQRLAPGQAFHEVEEEDAGGSEAPKRRRPRAAPQPAQS